MTGLEGRATMEAAVRRELFGPVDELPRGKPLTCAGGSARFDSKETARGLWHDSETGQEILALGVEGAHPPQMPGEMTVEDELGHDRLQQPRALPVVV